MPISTARRWAAAGLLGKACLADSARGPVWMVPAGVKPPVLRRGPKKK